MITSVLKSFFFARKHHLQFSDPLNYLYIFNEIFINKDYDAVVPHEGSCVFDIGGNIGLYTLYLGTQHKNIDIHVFEPVSTLFKQLEHNSIDAAAHNTIHLNNIGLSNANTETTINFFPRASGLSTLKDDIYDKRDISVRWRSRNALFPRLSRFLLTTLSKAHLRSKKEKVTLIRLSDYIDSRKIEVIDIIKIDVEGHELEVLQGIEPRHFHLINSFIIEVENFREGYQDKIVSLLEEQGYHISITAEKEPWSLVVAKR